MKNGRIITTCCFVVLLASYFTSCYKKEIQFGTDLPDSNTRIIAVDTVQPVMSMFVLDSFATSNNGILSIGRVKDVYLGNTSARTYFQFSVPTIGDLPEDATYDSMVLVLKPTAEYYGDTSVPLTYTVHELAEQPQYTHESRLYNTSSIPVKPTPIVTKTARFNPSTDSLTIRFPDSRGNLFFDKFVNNDPEFEDQDSFMEYFRGLSIGVSNSDEGAIYNYKTENVTLRLYYHTTTPDFKKHEITFNIGRQAYQFNQVLSDRTGTPLEPTFPGQQEFDVTEDQMYAFMHNCTGVWLKIRFPSIRNLLVVGETVKALTAELILKPIEGSFDAKGYRLPPSIFMMETDITNNPGYPLTDGSGANILYSYPEIDEVYNINTQYSFPLTAFANYLLETSDYRSKGVFVMEENSSAAIKLNRAVFGSSYTPKYKTKLKLTLLTTAE